MNIWAELGRKKDMVDVQEDVQFKRELEKVARYTSAQEIDLNVTPDGWEVKVYAYDSESEYWITLTIPKDRAQPLILTTEEPVVVKNLAGYDVEITPPFKM
jgi:hypothetical protein